MGRPSTHEMPSSPRSDLFPTLRACMEALGVDLKLQGGSAALLKKTAFRFLSYTLFTCIVLNMVMETHTLSSFVYSLTVAGMVRLGSTFTLAAYGSEDRLRDLFVGLEHALDSLGPSVSTPGEAQQLQQTIRFVKLLTRACLVSSFWVTGSLYVGVFALRTLGGITRLPAPIWPAPCDVQGAACYYLTMACEGCCMAYIALSYSTFTAVHLTLLTYIACLLRVLAARVRCLRSTCITNRRVAARLGEKLANAHRTSYGEIRHHQSLNTWESWDRMSEEEGSVMDIHNPQDITDGDLGAEMELVLDMLVRKHQELIRLVDLYNSCFSVTMAERQVGAVMFAGSCAVVLVSDATDISAFAVLIFDCATMYILAWFSELTIDASGDLMHTALLESDWLRAPPRVRSKLVLMLLRTLKPMGMKAGVFGYQTFGTFSRVMRTSYSLFQAMLQV